MGIKSTVELTRPECISRIESLLEDKKDRIIGKSEARNIAQRLYPKLEKPQTPLPNVLTEEEFNELLHGLDDLSDTALEQMLEDLEEDEFSNFSIVVPD